MSNKHPKLSVNTEFYQKKDSSLTFKESFNRPISANIKPADILKFSQTASRNNNRNEFPHIYPQTSIFIY